MGKRRPERAAVEELLKEGKWRKAYDIADKAGLIDAMGYDKAVDYVKRVRRTMRERGELAPSYARFGNDKDRLEDITRLFELRAGKMSKDAAYHMLLLNCYLRLRAEDDRVHMDAIDDTYRKNAELEKPLDMRIAIHICEIALERYTWSKDDRRNEAARKRGLPGSGLCYANNTIIDKCEITSDELLQLNSIRKE